MKYLLLKLDDERYWFELGEDGHVNRQIVLDEYKEFHVSCLEDCLAEEPVEESDLEGDVINLRKQEFEKVWQSVLKQYQDNWKGIKEKYPIGACVQGVNSYLYPQGSVIKGKDFIAIYKGNVPFCINRKVEYKIKSYDDINMWLVVE